MRSKTCPCSSFFMRREKKAIEIGRRRSRAPCLKVDDLCCANSPSSALRQQHRTKQDGLLRSMRTRHQHKSSSPPSSAPKQPPPGSSSMSCRAKPVVSKLLVFLYAYRNTFENKMRHHETSLHTTNGWTLCALSSKIHSGG